MLYNTSLENLKDEDFENTLKEYSTFLYYNRLIDTVSKERLTKERLKLNFKKWKKIKLSVLFEVRGSKTTDKKVLDEEHSTKERKYPYVTTQSTNNGVRGFYDIFTDEFKDEKGLDELFLIAKPIITSIFLRVNCHNLRVLMKAIKAVADISKIRDNYNDVHYIPSLVSLLIEDSVGQLRESSFYNFSSMTINIRKAMNGIDGLKHSAKESEKNQGIT